MRHFVSLAAVSLIAVVGCGPTSAPNASSTGPTPSAATTPSDASLTLVKLKLPGMT